MHINPTRVGDIVLGIVFRVHYQTLVVYIRYSLRIEKNLLIACNKFVDLVGE